MNPRTVNGSQLDAARPGGPVVKVAAGRTRGVYHGKPAVADGQQLQPCRAVGKHPRQAPHPCALLRGQRGHGERHVTTPRELTAASTVDFPAKRSSAFVPWTMRP